MIRTTIIGGALFLLPLVVIIFILGKAFSIAKHVAGPVEKIIPIESFAGVALINVLAIVLILVICYLAGFLARRQTMQHRMAALDEKMLSAIPVYAFVKTMMTSMVRAEEETNTLRPVLVALDDNSLIAFEVERSEDTVVVYLPGSPSPWSGSTAIFEMDRVTPLNIPSHQAAKLLQLLGRGSLEAIDKSRG